MSNNELIDITLLKVKHRNYKLHFAPRTIMNTSYTGIRRSIEVTDEEGHFNIWVQ